jgi:ABC-type uncharacterized transport system ATPase subunit
MSPAILSLDSHYTASPAYLYDSMREQPKWLAEWEDILVSLVSDGDVLGLLGVDTNGDVELFDTALISLERCAGKAVMVWPVRFVKQRGADDQT